MDLAYQKLSLQVQYTLFIHQQRRFKIAYYNILFICHLDNSEVPSKISNRDLNTLN